MIERAAGAAFSLILAAGAAKAGEPVIRHFFGMPFEVPTMIGALFGCIVTRVIVGQSDKVSRWFVRVPVDVLTIGVTFYVVLEARPGGLTALFLGITVASLGATIIKIAEARGRKLLDALLPGSEPDKPA
ncbi:hypothetical protein [Sphingomonas rubra]|uniref:Uncharacterized protein n=1 Tax=Sphingomonas rubra TaxID=634430 RepID=A0A1I5UUE0_9SPHN|nr:hypothetical protein [Sphingomonas rubra]SFP98657.1 hypothetical protein SAMN04488241_11614 [Sphingomonas rubra]